MKKTICNGWLGVTALAAIFLLLGIGEARALTVEVTPDQVPSLLEHYVAEARK